jgi:ADP-ribose diphosphatase
MPPHMPTPHRIVFSTPWFAIEETVPPPGQAAYYRMTGPDGAICMPLTPEGAIVMVWQYRPTIESDTIEMPAGAIEAGETPEECAARELAEETGHRCAALLPLGPGRVHLNRCTHREHFVLGIDAVPVLGQRIETALSPLIISRAEFREMVREDRFQQIAALSFFAMASAKLDLDLLSDPIDRIRDRVHEALNGAQ